MELIISVQLLNCYTALRLALSQLVVFESERWSGHNNFYQELSVLIYL